MRQRQTVSEAPVVLLLTIEQAAQALNIGRSLMYELVLKKRIASVKVSRYRRVSIQSLQAFIDQQAQEEVY